ncbi:MAG TPA: hypothetical protein VFZ52_15315 [Chryseolinea sp.]
MSSHHFVKEGQEPALFILDNIAFRHVASLLEWVPLIMVADRALEYVLPWRIKIDVVLQHDNADTIESLVNDQGPVEIVPVLDASIVARGLQYLRENDYGAVNLLCHVDDIIFSEVEGSAKKLTVGLYDEEEKWSFISLGKFEKWMPLETTIRIRGARPIQTTGLVQIGDAWQTLGTGLVTVRSECAFWIGETL